MFVGKDFGKVYMQFCDKFQYTDNLGRFGCILIDKNNRKNLLKLCIYLFAFQSLQFSHCSSVAAIQLLHFTRWISMGFVSVASQITASSLELFFVGVDLTLG